jgi:hypothetical protein
MMNKQSAVEQKAESNVCACAVVRHGALCETQNESGGNNERYLKMSLFQSDSRKCGFKRSKIYFEIFFQRHILRSQAYGWIGVRKIWVFSKQSSYVDERVKVRIFIKLERKGTKQGDRR